MGESGDPGFSGRPGLRGHPGLQGEAGQALGAPKGQRGLPGDPGIQGYGGMPGPAGTPGMWSFLGLPRVSMSHLFLFMDTFTFFPEYIFFVYDFLFCISSSLVVPLSSSFLHCVSFSSPFASLKPHC